MLYVSNDADNLIPLRVVSRKRDAFSDRISIRPILTHERTVHDRDLLSIGQIVTSKFTTRKERDSHRREVSGSHESDLFVRSRLALSSWLILDHESAIAATAAEWQQVDTTNRLHFRTCLEAIE